MKKAPILNGMYISSEEWNKEHRKHVIAIETKALEDELRWDAAVKSGKPFTTGGILTYLQHR